MTKDLALSRLFLESNSLRLSPTEMIKFFIVEESASFSNIIRPIILLGVMMSRSLPIEAIVWPVMLTFSVLMDSMFFKKVVISSRILVPPKILITMYEDTPEANVAIASPIPLIEAAEILEMSLFPLNKSVSLGFSDFDEVLDSEDENFLELLEFCSILETVPKIS